MTDDQRNALNYALLAAGAFAFGCLTALVPQLMDPTMPDLNFRIVIGTGLSALVAAYGGSFLPRQGSAAISRQVNDLSAAGVSRRDMAVVRADDVANMVDVARMTPAQRRSLASELRAEMQAHL